MYSEVQVILASISESETLQQIGNAILLTENRAHECALPCYHLSAAASSYVRKKGIQIHSTNLLASSW